MPKTRIYIDLTTAFEERHSIPHGTTRVERKLVAALVGLNRDDVSFCRFDPRTRHFVAMSSQEALAAVTTAPVVDTKRQARVSSRRSPIIAKLQKLEVWIRRNIRGRFRRARGKLVRMTVPNVDFFEPESVILLPGELQRQDFAKLMELR